jgi:beta-glucanase (GH16 family)
MIHRVYDYLHVQLKCQWAPYNAGYAWDESYATVYDPTMTKVNEYIGGVYQQTTSGLSITNQDCYELNTGCYSIYGFEYRPGYETDRKLLHMVRFTPTHYV